MAKLDEYKIWLYLIVIILAFCDKVIGSYVKNYEKWKLFNVESMAVKNHHFLDQLERLHHVKIIDRLKEKVQIGLGPEVDRKLFEDLLCRYNSTAKLLHSNIANLIRSVEKKSKRSVREVHFERYMPLHKMEKFFDSLESSHPGIIRREVIGRSYEGRNISMFIISSGSSSELRRPCLHEPRPSSGTRENHHFTNNINKPKRNEVNDLTPHQNDILLRYYQQFRRLIINRLRQGRGNHHQRSRRQLSSGLNDTHNVIFLSPDFMKPFITSERPMKKNKKERKKPIIFVDAGLHSREWVSPAAALYLITKLAETPSLRKRIDWYIIPMANPDGYQFSWNGDRFWRKTRSPSKHPHCFGADMNRNFDYRWREVDTSLNPCSEHYGGEAPNSEIETVHIQNVLQRERERLLAYVSLHNWGQDILYPYVFDRQTLPDTLSQLERVAAGMSSAIRQTQRVEYKTGRGSDLLYPASGTSIDWAYDALRVPYTYLIELRDKLGLLGFLLPDTFIRPTGEDLLAAMKYLAEEVIKTDINSCQS